MIKETNSLLSEVKNPVYKRQLEVNLKSYLAIKNLFDSLNKDKKL